MSQTLHIKTNYTPRPFQNILHKNLKRFNVLCLHRRFGKTVFAVNEMIDRALRNPLKNPQMAYLSPYYSQSKRVAWDMIKTYTQMIPGVTYNEAELRVDIPRPAQGDRIRFMLLGADNPGALRGIYLDGVIMDEVAEMSPEVWSSVVRPALSDRLGWAIFIGTPKGTNHFYKLFKYATSEENKDWYGAIFKASETNVIPASELSAAQGTMSEEEYAQEYECSFTSALVGAYYGKILNSIEGKGQITKVPYDPSAPVITGWDLGIGDTTTVWFMQNVGRERHIIDYLEMSGMGLDWYVRTLRSKPYMYEEHLLPHDAEARELGTGKTRIETLRKLWPNMRFTVVPRQSVDDGIHAVRMMLPLCWFDKVATDKGLEALKSYQRKWDSKNQIFMDKPLHDWASHAADGFRTLAMGLRPNMSESAASLNFPRETQSNYDIFGGV